VKSRENRESLSHSRVKGKGVLKGLRRLESKLTKKPQRRREMQKVAKNTLLKRRKYYGKASESREKRRKKLKEKRESPEREKDTPPEGTKNQEYTIASTAGTAFLQVDGQKEK